MTSRSQLKTQAKSVLRPNYWKIVLVSLIFSLIAGGGSSDFINVTRTVSQQGSRIIVDTYSNEMPEDDAFDSEFGGLPDDFYFGDDRITINTTPDGLIQSISVMIREFFSVVNPVLLTLFLIVVMALSISLGCLIFAPLEIGCTRFFLVSQHFPAQMKEVSYTFDTSYWNGVKIMFLRGFKTFLWTLLLVIPGIVKSYEYRMIPYLLAEHPDMTAQEAFEASRFLMDGNKWRLFVLEWSFILWNILASATLGIVGLLYVNPYRNLTYAAFYEAVCREKQRQPEF